MSRRESRRTSFSRIPETSRTKALQMIADGAYRIDISRACFISPNSVDQLAKKAGLTLKKMQRGHWSLHRPAPPKAAPTVGTNWRAVAANARWGGKGFDI